MNLDEIKTERLKLAPLSKNDAERFIEIAKNMRLKKEKNPDYLLFVRFDFDVAPTENDIKNAVMEILTREERTAPPEIKKCRSIRLNNDYIIGYVGFSHNPKDEISSDLGIFLDPQYEHMGYAFEAQKSLLAYYFLAFDDKMYLTIYPKNTPSYKLNTKCGAVKIGHIDNSKYGAERDILVITRKMFIKTVFNKEFPTKEEENQFLLDYLKQYNEI